MRFLLRRNKALATAAALALVGGLAAAGMVAATDRSPDQAPPPPSQAEYPTLGLMGTIPLYWGEPEAISDILGGEAEPHWARAQLEQQFRLRPLAALTEEELTGLDLLLLAQPRALSPSENVALDDWVRSGGRLLLFADPLLTGESRFGVGDRRRPQDVILLSPILRRWGLELEFEEDQTAGLSLREIAGRPVPVNLPGRFAPPVQGDCTLEAGGLLADCAIGTGRAVVLADAALLDLHHPAPESARALAMLTERAFGAGDFTGGPPASLTPEAPPRAFPAGPPLQDSGSKGYQSLTASAQNPP